MAELNYQEEGRKVLTAFYSTLNALKLYPVENATVQQAVSELHGLVTRVLNVDGGVELRVVGDFFFLNETRLRLYLSNFATFGSFARSLQDHGIGAVEIFSGIRRNEWVPFIAILLHKPQGEDPFAGFMERVSEAPVEHIEFRPEKDGEEPEAGWVGGREPIEHLMVRGVECSGACRRRDTVAECEVRVAA